MGYTTIPELHELCQVVEALFRLWVCVPRQLCLLLAFVSRSFFLTITLILVNILLCYSLVLIWDPKSLRHLAFCAEKLHVPIGLGPKDPLRLKDKGMSVVVLFTLVRKKIFESKLEFKLRKQLTISWTSSQGCSQICMKVAEEGN